MKKALFRLMFPAALICLAGCSTGYEIYDPPPREKALTEAEMCAKHRAVKVFNVMPRQLEVMRKEFEAAPEGAQLAVNSIAFYNRPDPMHFDHKEAAHCHLDGRRDLSGYVPKYLRWMPQILRKQCDICIDALHFHCGLTRHEITHAQIESEEIDLNEFQKICASDYEGTFWRIQTPARFPRDGFLHPYDTQDVGEHVADLVATIGCLAMGLPDPYTGMDAFRGIDFGDNRYWREVQEVYRLGLITKDEYDKVSAFFAEHKNRG